MDPVRSRLWFVYVLASRKTNGWYIGSTYHMQKRLLAHNSGKNRSTAHGRPWKLIYCEIGLHKSDTRAREKYLKSGQGRRYLKNRLKSFLHADF